MDARKFFYVCAGILCLVAAYQLGASRAIADWGGSGLVVGIADGEIAWNAQGQAYDTDTPSQWVRDPNYDLPVPAADVRLIDGNTTEILLVTNSDAVHYWGNGSWHPMPALPGGPVPVRGQSFGKTKVKYR